MFRRIIDQGRWADMSVLQGLLRMVYFNTIKINRFLIYELNLKDIKEDGHDKDGYIIKTIQYDEMEKYLPQNRNLPREFRMHKIHGVKYCTLVLIDNTIAHICWVYMKGDKNRWFNLMGDEAHCNYVFTFPEYRGKGLFPKGLVATSLWLKKKGFRRVLINVHEETVFMINSLQKIPEVRNIGVLTQWFIYRPKYKG